MLIVCSYTYIIIASFILFFYHFFIFILKAFAKKINWIKVFKLPKLTSH